jgi:hypothetical protein
MEAVQDLDFEDDTSLIGVGHGGDRRTGARKRCEYPTAHGQLVEVGVHAGTDRIVIRARGPSEFGVRYTTVDQIIGVEGYTNTAPVAVPRSTPSSRPPLQLDPESSRQKPVLLAQNSAPKPPNRDLRTTTSTNTATASRPPA